MKDRNLVDERAANTRDFVLHRTRLETGKQMFSYHAVKLWNSLPDPIRSLPKKQFKQNI